MLEALSKTETLLLMNPETMKARFDIDVRISSEVTAIDRENKKLAVLIKSRGRHMRNLTMTL